MAETVLLTWNYNGNFYFQLTYEVSQNIESAESTVTIRLKSKGDSQVYHHYLDASITTGGVNHVYRKYYNDLRIDQKSDAYLLLTSWTFTVTHDSQGNGSFSYSIVCPPSPAQSSKWGVYVPGKYGTVFVTHEDVNATVTLPQIPRASDYSSCPSSATTGSAMAITVSRKSNTYYHKIQFLYGSTVIATSGAFQTSLSYTPSHSWMTNNVNATYINVTARLRTYTSSACTTQVGNHVDRTIKINAAASIKPAITAKTLSAYGTGHSISGFVQGYSRVRAVITANNNACQGAAITDYKLVVGGMTKHGSSSTQTTDDAISVSGTVPYTITVTDQRGRTATETGNINVYAYAVPTIAVSECYRCNSSGVADEDSRRIAMKASVTFSSLNGQNSVSLTATASGRSFTLTSGTRTISGEYFDPDTTLSVTFTVTDAMGNSVTFTKTIPTRVWALQFYDRAEGAAFGKAAEHRKSLEIPGDWVIRIGNTTLSDRASNRNLLDNPWFSVNQRNNNSYTSTGTAILSVDRWRIQRGTLTKTANGISFLWNGSGSDGYICQRMPKETLDSVIGKTVTISAIINGATVTASGTVNATTGSTDTVCQSNHPHGGFRLRRYSSSYDYDELMIYWTSAFTDTVSAVKVEVGSVSTLANDPIPNFQQELAKCQRYYYRSLSYSYPFRFTMITANDIFFIFPLPVPMRINSPTIASNAPTVRSIDGTAKSGFSIIVDGGTDGLLRFKATKSAHGMTDGCFYVASMELSAEL